MCAPCKVILNEVDDVVSTGGNIHTAVNTAVQKVIDDLPSDVQNKLSRLDVRYTRRRLADDVEYYDELVEILSEFAGEEF